VTTAIASCQNDNEKWIPDYCLGNDGAVDCDDDIGVSAFSPVMPEEFCRASTLVFMLK
jgi:hypothetical protein